MIYKNSTVDAALYKRTSQSSTFIAHNVPFSANKAVDGGKGTHLFDGSCTHTKYEEGPWWEVDLGFNYNITGVEITNRGDCCGDRLKNFNVTVDDAL